MHLLGTGFKRRNQLQRSYKGNQNRNSAHTKNHPVVASTGPRLPRDAHLFRDKSQKSRWQRKLRKYQYPVQRRRRGHGQNGLGRMDDLAEHVGDTEGEEKREQRKRLSGQQAG